jgi:hypothetical protein
MAVLQLLCTESTMIRGFFLKKEPPCTQLNRAHELENCSKIPSKRALYQGTTSVVPQNASKMKSGFIAVLQLLYTESTMIRGFFLKKEPPCTQLNRAHELENCSKIPSKRALYQGTTSVVPQNASKMKSGFSPCRSSSRRWSPDPTFQCLAMSPSYKSHLRRFQARFPNPARTAQLEPRR